MKIVRINIKLFSVSLILALVSGTITGFFQYLTLWWMNLPNSTGIATSLEIAALLINPIIIFVVFYYLGKKYDLSKLLVVAVVSIFSGLIIGYWLTNITFLTISLYIIPATSSDNILYYMLTIAFAIEYSISTFFVMFASLAIGYFRGNQGKSALHSNGSAEAINSSTT